MHDLWLTQACLRRIHRQETDLSAPAPFTDLLNLVSRRYENASSLAHIHDEDVPPRAQDNSADGLLTSITKTWQLQPSDATVPLVETAGRRKTPTEILELPDYDRPEPTLLGIPADIRLRILKLAFPDTIEVFVRTKSDLHEKHILKYRVPEFVKVRFYSVLRTRFVLAPASPLPSFMHCSRKLYDEGSEVVGFRIFHKYARPLHFKSYPLVLCKNTKTIEFGARALWGDHAPLFANLPRLRELDFSSIFLESPTFMHLAATTWRAQAVAGLVWLETPIPNPDKTNFTRRVLPRFTSQGQRLLRDRFHDAVYKNNIKITFNCLLGPFEPCETGSPHNFREFVALARFTWTQKGVTLVMWKDFEEAGQFERTCIEGRGNLKGLQPLTSQPCGSVSCEGNCAGCMEIDQYSVDMRDKSP